MRADSIAKLLGVTWAERRACKLRTIGAVDMNKKQRLVERERTHADRQKSARAKRGAVSRAEYLAASKTRAKPWLKDGLSRAAWYRRHRASETSPCATLDAIGAQEEGPETGPCAVYVDTKLVTDLSHETLAISSSNKQAQRSRYDTLSPEWAEDELREAFWRYESGTLPSFIRQALRSQLASRGAPAEQIAAFLELTVEQLGEAVEGRFALPERSVLRLRAWLFGGFNRGTAPTPPAPLPTPPSGTEAQPAAAAPSAWVVPPDDTVQLTLLPPAQADDELRAAAEAWTSGVMPKPVIVGILAAKRRRAVRQIDIAQAVGISRPQLANVVAGTFNLSPAAITRLVAWLLAPDAALPNAPGEAEAAAQRRPSRRGARKRQEPGPGAPTMRLFRMITGGKRTGEQCEIRRERGLSTAAS